MAAQKIIFLVTLVSFVGNSSHIKENVSPPVIGDIKLMRYSEAGLQGIYYQPLVYYTDGIVEPEYRGICSDREQSVGKVICRQVGFSDLENVDVKARSTGQTVWFKNSKCDDTSSHILRCKHDFVPNDMRHPRICGPNAQTMIVRCDFSDPVQQHPYDGEIQLCAPDNHINYIESDVKVSVSFGVVRMYFDEHSAWRGINQFNAQTDLLGSIEADTICKQMGYTGAIPGSAIARSASNYTFDKCYRERLHSSAWMKTTAINCNNTVPQNCLRCCYDYKLVVIASGCAECDEYHDIIIGCTFDTTVIKLNIKGTQQDCTLNNEKRVQNCARAQPVSESHCSKGGEIAFGILFGISLIIIIIMLILYCKKCFVKGKENIPLQ